MSDQVDKDRFEFSLNFVREKEENIDLFELQMKHFIQILRALCSLKSLVCCKINSALTVDEFPSPLEGI